MGVTLPAGPFGSLRLAGHDVPFYAIPFDKDGVLQAPATAARLVADVRDGAPQFTDVVVVIHGWNTEFTGAVDLTRAIVSRLDAAIGAHGSPRAQFRPLVVAVSWPSIVLPSTEAPAMAGGTANDVDIDELTALAHELVAPADREEFYQLTQSDSLNRDEATRLAQLLAPLYTAADGDLPDAGGSKPAETVAAWAEAQKLLAEAAEGPVIVSGPTGPRAPGGAQAPTGSAGGPAPGGPSGGPAPAGFLDVLDPRNIVRMATVLLMKDRAGVVGFRGVGPLVARILGARDDVRVHLVGHSYGCKVALSAISSSVPRSVRSVLLLQPALSYLALADDVPGLGKPGGYAVAKGRSELPIMATWSTRDIPLHLVFALAVRRSEDLGEQNIGAAGREDPPSRFAAMGGWGAQPGHDVTDVTILLPGDGRYALASGARVLSVEGTKAISGHGDVTSDATAWALYNLVAG